MDHHAPHILQNKTFKSLSKEAVQEILRRECFFDPKMQIFLAVWKWSKHNRNTDIRAVVSYVRLPLMDLSYLLQVVRPSDIIDPNELLDAIEAENAFKYLKYRTALWSEENVATEKFHSRTIHSCS